MKSRDLKIFRWVRPDFFVVTLLLFITVALVELFALNLTFFNPVEKALTDFNFSDLLYSKLSSKQELLDKRIRSFHPKVIGFDGFFSVRRDSTVDAMLLEQLSQERNLAMACYLVDRNTADGSFDSLETSDPYFNTGERAIVNLGGANPETSTVRTFSPVQVFKGDTLWAMAAEVVRKYDPAAFSRLARRNNVREIINYTGNHNAFISYDAEEVLDSTSDLSMIKDKIVLMGYIGNSFRNVNDLEDIYFTPMNPELAGRSRPDMYGVVIHANAASMILSGNYINVMPEWLQILFSFIFCYLYVLFFTWFNSRNPALFDLLFPAILLAINVLIVYTFFILYKTFSYSIYATYFLIPVLFYKLFLTWYERAIHVIARRIQVHPFLLPPKPKP
ncbi:MAG: CHASE2 domain-containing protein [Bacteroidetes bacterium]|nr:CHASE2 domain-containing protein [Bacteroidota bacterium]